MKLREAGTQEDAEIYNGQFSEEFDSYLQTLDRWQECERQREEGSGTEFPQLSPWHTTPVDWPGVAHLQHQVHGSFTTTSKSQKRPFNIRNKIALTVVWYGQQDEDFYLQLVILQIMSKGSSRLTVSGIISRDSLISPYPGAWTKPRAKRSMKG